MSYNNVGMYLSRRSRANRPCFSPLVIFIFCVYRIALWRQPNRILYAGVFRPCRFVTRFVVIDSRSFFLFVNYYLRIHSIHFSRPIVVVNTRRWRRAFYLKNIGRAVNAVANTNYKQIFAKNILSLKVHWYILLYYIGRVRLSEKCFFFLLISRIIYIYSSIYRCWSLKELWELNNRYRRLNIRFRPIKSHRASPHNNIEIIF